MLLRLFVVAIFGVFTLAQQTQTRRDPVEYIKTLESERRVAGLHVAQVVESLKIGQGQRVADLGSGSGLFTRPIAKVVGDKGVVYAIDIDPDLLKHVEKTARDEQLTNIRTVLAIESDPKLPEAVDLIAIIDTLHHIDNRPTYLSNLKRYLRPGGRIAIIDFSETWPVGHEAMRYSFADLQSWMEKGGYERSEKFDFLTNNFFVVYRLKP
ncbi:MAG: class I SAM-dependent methyltransferase [Acidobacteriota bacterium]